jgi:hypothetical protein
VSSRHVTPLAFIFLSLLGLLLAGCSLPRSISQSSAVIGEPKVVDPSPPVPPGAEVSVSLEITSPEPVAYHWRTDAGGGQIVRGETSSAVTWQAPPQEGTYNVYVAVTIAGQVTEKSVAIKVETAPPPTPTTESIAVIGWVKGQVKVQRYEERLIAATAGLALFSGDIVTSPEQSLAHIYCFGVGLFELQPGRTVTLTCEPEPPEGLKLILAELPAGLDNLVKDAAGADPTGLDTLDSVRGGRSRSLAELGQVPILLAPRQLTPEARPTFRWTAVTQAEAYTLKVQGPVDNWEVTLAADEIPISEAAPFVIPEATVLETVYPDNAFALEPGTTYIVTLQAHLPGVEAPQESSEPLFFELLDKDLAASLAGSATQIQKLAAPDDEKTYLLALLYRQYGLWTAAVEQMETLARRSPESPPLLPLGDLYLRAGLTDLAEANYRRALDTAQAGDDPYTQATALTGLGQTAYVAQADDDAAEYLEQALAFYRELREERLAGTVEKLLMEIKGP